MVAVRDRGPAAAPVARRAREDLRGPARRAAPAGRRAGAGGAGPGRCCSSTSGTCRSCAASTSATWPRTTASAPCPSPRPAGRSSTATGRILAENRSSFNVVADHRAQATTWTEPWSAWPSSSRSIPRQVRERLNTPGPALPLGGGQGGRERGGRGHRRGAPPGGARGQRRRGAAALLSAGPAACAHILGLRGRDHGPPARARAASRASSRGRWWARPASSCSTTAS